MEIIVREAISRSDLKKFVHFPNELYKGNKYYVPQIESMDMDTFDKNKNHAFEVCEGKFFLAFDQRGKVVGRVAGIINHAYNKKVGEKLCRFGWLDFIEDIEVLKALMASVEQYAASMGMTVMNGPVGFLEFDVAGVLVEGFDKIPSAYGKYNAPYYDRMLTSLGYVKDVDWVEFMVDLTKGFDYERNHRLAALLAQKYGLHHAPINRRKDLYKYVDEAFKVMNVAYRDLHGYSELSQGQTDDLKRQFLSNGNPGLADVILDKNEKAVAFIFWLPSLSKALQKAGGSLFPFGWFHILRAMKHNDTVNSLLVGILPEYQNKGLNALFFDKLFLCIKKMGIKYLETTRELETNSKVQNLMGHFDNQLHQRSRCYLKNLQ